MRTTPDKTLLTWLGASDNMFATGEYPKRFEFNDEVARVFDDMVQRSIPLYQDVTEYVCDWALRYYQPGSWIVDIGCSTGTAIAYVGQRLTGAGRFMGIDNAPAMIARASSKLTAFPSRHELRMVCDDLFNVPLEPASVVIINYTLQFIPIAQRRRVLAMAYEALLPGGLLFVSEKVRSTCPRFQETVTGIYEGFKEQHGYSRTEIERKKEALDNVLVPLTEEQQRGLITSVGFEFCESVIKWNNFLSLVALKDDA